MSQLKVSIITPSYNRGQFIEDTIKSVLNQTYKNIQYIVVDGMSTDNTLAILESYRKKGELTYISEKDNGMYYAINKGIEIATGDIIAYLNSDDLYFPWTVQSAVEVFQKDNSVDMVYGDSMVSDILNNKKYLNIYDSHKKYWLEAGGTLCQPTVFLRKKIFQTVGYFNTEYKYLADCEYWLRVNESNEFNIIKIDEVMAIEFNHGETFRERLKEEIINEKNKLFRTFGKKYRNKRGLLVFLNLKSNFNKELKLWKFIIMNYLKKNNEIEAWNNFVRNYYVRFNFLNYILCKLFVRRTKFPRFSIKEITT